MTNTNKFVWFGSAGIIHKGLDILIDAFAEMSDLQLDIYGAPHEEIDYLRCPANVFVYERIDVSSDDFINEVVNKHVFVLSLSCSEGMMSGIATCMLAGLIPIVTKETGYDDCPFVFSFDDWHIEKVKEKLRECVGVSPDELKMRSSRVKEWAYNHNTNRQLKESFDNIL